MHQYSAYGIGIRSALPLPELLPGRGGADVEVLVERAADAAPDRPDEDCDDSVALSADDSVVRWRSVGVFRVRGGRSITVQPFRKADPRLLRLGVLGPSMALLLQQRGFVVLHASVVSLHGRAVAFLGASGWGKSTLAAALHARGHKLVVDDIAAVRADANGIAVYSGFPQLRLWPDALAALGERATGLPRLDPAYTKRVRPVEQGFAAGEALSLERAFVLSRGEQLRLERLSTRDAFLELVCHSYGIGWMHEISGPAQFAPRALIARSIPIWRLERPWDLRMLPATLDAIEAADA